MQPNLYKDILDNLYDGVYLVDLTRRITYWNRAAEQITGYRAEEMVGNQCGQNLLRHITDKGEELCLTTCPLAQTLEDGKSREAEVFLHHKNGHRVPIVTRISPLHDEAGKVVGAVEVFSDATARRRMREELSDLKQKILVDPLTGLYNRRGIAREFERRMGELRRYNVPFGLLFADIDRFKDINDAYGHKTGDQVLVAVGKTLRSALREIDTVARWGGEEYLAVVPRVDVATFRTVAERMRRFVELSPIPAPEGLLPVTISVGGALTQADDSLEGLVARADALMYEAKQAGRNRCVFEDEANPMEP